jgi:hypothetical protein
MATSDPNKNQGAAGGTGSGQDVPHTPRPGDKAASPFIVDGKQVAEEEYFKAAEKSPWDVQFLRERKYYPEIVTK